MRTEYASVDMRFVDDDDFQVLEKARPAGMKRKETEMDHIRIRQQDPDVFLDNAPVSRVGIAVEDRDLRTEFGEEATECRQLVLRQRFRRKDQQRAVDRRQQRLLKDRNLVAEALPARRPCGDDDVVMVINSGQRLGLMTIDAEDPAFGEAEPDPRVDEGRERDEFRFFGG